MDYNNNFTALLSTIAFIVTEYFITFKELFCDTITLFFFVINSQVSMYFKIFNNLFEINQDQINISLSVLYSENDVIQINFSDPEL